MPIIGLTDRGASFPRIGTLRKGAPKPEPDPTAQTRPRPGKDLDYFRFDSSDPTALAAFSAAYGKEPRAIHVFLPFMTVSESFITWQEEYAAGGLVHRCDGRTMVLWRDETGKFRQEQRPCPYASGQKQRSGKEPGCRPVGTLKVVIPELKRLAYVSVATTSIHDIMELQANLEAVMAMRGDLRGIPFILSRRSRMISMPGEDGKRVRREKWLLSIEPSPDWVALQLQAMERQAFLEVVQPLELAARAASTPVEVERMNGLAPDGEDGTDWVDLETGEIGNVSLPSKSFPAPPPSPSSPSPLAARQASISTAPCPIPDFAAKLKDVKGRKTLHAPVEGPYGAVMAVLTGLVGGREQRLALLSAVVGRPLASSKEMTLAEQVALFETLKPWGGNGSGWHVHKEAEDAIVRWCMTQSADSGQGDGKAPPTEPSADGFPELAEVLHPRSTYLTAVEAGL